VFIELRVVRAERFVCLRIDGPISQRTRLEYRACPVGAEADSTLTHTVLASQRVRTGKIRKATWPKRKTHQRRPQDRNSGHPCIQNRNGESLCNEGHPGRLSLGTRSYSRLAKAAAALTCCRL